MNPSIQLSAKSLGIRKERDWVYLPCLQKGNKGLRHHQRDCSEERNQPLARTNTKHQTRYHDLHADLPECNSEHSTTTPNLTTNIIPAKTN